MRLHSLMLRCCRLASLMHQPMLRFSFARTTQRTPHALLQLLHARQRKFVPNSPEIPDSCRISTRAALLFLANPLFSPLHSNPSINPDGFQPPVISALEGLSFCLSRHAPMNPRFFPQLWQIASQAPVSLTREWGHLRCFHQPGKQINPYPAAATISAAKPMASSATGFIIQNQNASIFSSFFTLTVAF